MTVKLLVTSGCSFTVPDANSTEKWPMQLASKLAVPLSNSGMQSQGNGLISRKIIYQITEALKTRSSDELLVGIMWSGPDRHDFYVDNCEDLSNWKNVDGWRENPTHLDSNTDKKWVILNHEWSNSYAKSYYGMFHDEIGSLIYTYEHILRVQWFLKLHKIKYFMTTYMQSVFPEKNNIDIKHLYGQIDFDQFLPVKGQYEWAVDTGMLFFPMSNGSGIDEHPTAEHNQRFTNEIIMPFLQRKNYI